MHYKKSLISIILLIGTAIIFYACPFFERFDFSEVLELVDKGEYSIAASQIEERAPKEKEDLRYQMYFVLGKCYEAMELWDKAARSYQQSIVPESEISDYATYHVAECYENMENYENAAYWYELFIEDYPKSLKYEDALYNLSEIYLNIEKYESVIDINEKIISENAKEYIRLAATFNSGKACEELHRWEKAKYFYDKVIDTSSSDSKAQEALSAIQRLISEHKELKITRSQYFNYGMVMYNARDYRTAREFFRKALSNSKDNLAVKTAYYIAKSYELQRLYKRAIDEYQKVAKNYPNSLYYTTSLYRIPYCYRRRGYLTKAASLYKKFAEKYHWSKFADDALYNRADIFKDQNKFNNAVTAYVELIRKYNRSGFLDDALWWNGWCQFNLGKYNESLDTFSSLVSRYPNSKYSEQAKFWIGKSYEMLKLWEEAITIYKKIIEKNSWYYSIQAEERIRELIENKKITNNWLQNPNIIPHYRTNISTDREVWNNIPKLVTSKIKLLMKLKAFDDAILELEDIRNQSNINRSSVYYNLIICSKKLGNYGKTYNYSHTLSKILPTETIDGLNPLEIQKLLYPLYFQELINKYSAKYKVDKLFIAAMIREESKYDPEAISWANAYGLMQIIPSTGRDVASRIGIKDFRTPMLYQPEVNIHIGVWYTKNLLDQFNNYALVAGAYNCGPGIVKRWIKEHGLNDIDQFIENVPFTETRNHIKKVMDSYRIYKELYSDTLGVEG